MNLAALDIKQLYYFVGVIDAGSINRASANLHIAQPALSKRITDLEHALRSTLLHRSSLGITPTEEGRILYDAAKRALREIQVAADEVAALHSEPVGTVVAGLPHSMASLLSVPLYAAIRQHYPKIRFVMVEAKSMPLSRMIEQAELDLALRVDYGKTGNIESRFGGVEKVLLVEAGAMDPDADVPPITLEDLRGLPLAMPSESRSSFRASLATMLEPFGFTPSADVEIDSLVGIKRYVMQGMGYTLLPWSAVHDEVDTGRLRLRELAGIPLLCRFQLCGPSMRPLSTAANAVAAMIEQVLTEMIGSGAWRYATLA